MSSLKVTIGIHKSKPFINVYVDKVRYRFWNVKSIDTPIKYIENPSLLKAAFELKLRAGWRPTPKEKEDVNPTITVIQALCCGVETKVGQRVFRTFYKGC